MTGKKLIVLWLGMACSLHALAQQVDATLQPKAIRIGEAATLTLSVRVQKGAYDDIIFPAISDTLIAAVEVLHVGPVDTLKTGSGVSETRLEQKLTITSFDSGYYALPPLSVVLKGDTQQTAAFLLTVSSVPIDTTALFKPAKGAFEVHVTWRDYLQAYWPYAAGALALVALVLGAYYWYKHAQARRRRKPELVPPPKPISADEAALQALEKLEKEAYYRHGEVKLHHSLLTDIIRAYLHHVFDIQSQEMTSAQILRSLRFSGMDTVTMRKLATVLQRADLVKFAKESPDETENIASLAMAREFVLSTRKSIDPQEEAEGEKH